MSAPEDPFAPPKRRVGRPRIDVPDPIDIHIGKRMKVRRTLLGLSQQRLGERLGLTFQQVQKYEKGTNRLSASRLHQLGRALNVTVAFFYENGPEPTLPAHWPASNAPGLSEDPAPFENEPSADHSLMTKRETLELVRAYYRIPREETRRLLVDLMRSAVTEGDPKDAEDQAN